MRKVATGATVGGSLGGAIGENFLLRPPQVFNETLRIAALPRGVRILQVPFLTRLLPSVFFPSSFHRASPKLDDDDAWFLFFLGVYRGYGRCDVRDLRSVQVPGKHLGIPPSSHAWRT